MKIVFQGRLRKLGFGFLAMAIMLTCVWQVSVSGWIDIARSYGEWQYYFLADGDDFTIWRFKPAASAKRDNHFSIELWPRKEMKYWRNAFCRADINQSAGLAEIVDRCGFGTDGSDKAYAVPEAPTQVSTITLSYWTVVLPLTLFSGTLLFWKPIVRSSSDVIRNWRAVE